MGYFVSIGHNIGAVYSSSLSGLRNFIGKLYSGSWRAVCISLLLTPCSQAAIWTCAALAGLIIGARLVLHFRDTSLGRNRRDDRISDALIVTAYALALVNTGLQTFLAVYSDFFRNARAHMPAAAAFIRKGFKVQFVILVNYFFALTMIRISFLVIYYKVTQNLGKKFRIPLAMITFYVFACFVINIGMSFGYCRPLWTAWDPFGLCATFRRPIGYLVAYITNASSDLLLILYALFLLSTLRFRRHELYGVAFILFLGLLSMGASTARVVLLIVEQRKHTWTGRPCMWSAVEIAAALIAACLPAFRLLIQRYVDRVRSRRGSRKSEGRGSRGQGSGSPGSGESSLVRKWSPNSGDRKEGRFGSGEGSLDNTVVGPDPEMGQVR